MPNPTPYTVLQAQIGKTEQNAADHKTAADTHAERHLEARDAERNAKTAAKRAGTDTH